MSTFINLADSATGGGHNINLWWADSQPDRIHLVFADPRMHDGNGEKPGLRIVFSSNPKSADYSPANFNRCARLLREQDLPAPSQDVEEHPRHLRYRDKVIESTIGASASLTPSALPAGGNKPVTVPEEALLCSICSSFVADLDVHEKAMH